MLLSNGIINRIDNLESKLPNLAYPERLDSVIHLVHLCRYQKPEIGLKIGEETLDNIKNNSKYLSFKAYLLNGLGEIYNRLDNHDKANEYYFNALDIFNKIKDKNGKALVLYNIGYNEISFGRFKESGNYFLDALNLSKECNNKQIESNANNGLAILNYIVGNYKTALERANSALNIATQINYKSGIALANGHLGLIYLDLRNIEKSLYHLNKSLDYYVYINDLFSIGETYDAIGVYYVIINDNTKAIDVLNKSISISEKLGLQNSLASAYTNLGVAYENLDQLDLSLYYLKKALQIISNINNNRLRYYIHRRLSFTYEKKGDYKSSLENYRLYKAYSDSVYDNVKNLIIQGVEKEAEAVKKLSKAKQIEAESKLIKQTQLFLIIVLVFTLFLLLSVYYFFRQKRKSNILLTQMNDRLEIKSNKLQTLNKELEQTNEEKDKFISILAHDLRSPFFGILGTTSLMHNKYDNYSNEERKSLLVSLNSSLQALFTLLENLLNFGRFYKGKIKFNPINLNICNTVKDILNLLKFNIEEKNITLTTKNCNNFIVFADKNMLEIILRNLLSNAIKFVKQNGKIEISAEDLGNFIKINVTDNGVGINKENLEKINSQQEFTTIGSKDEKGTGLGLTLCKDFIKVNKGEFGIESQENIGTTVWFTLPKAN